MRRRVLAKMRISWRGLTPRSAAEISAATKHADPVAESQLKSYLAGSGVGCATTGAARITARCSSGTSQPPRSKAGVVARLIAFLIDGTPHNSTQSESTVNGSQARKTVASCWLPVASVDEGASFL